MRLIRIRGCPGIDSGRQFLEALLEFIVFEVKDGAAIVFGVAGVDDELSKPPIWNLLPHLAKEPCYAGDAFGISHDGFGWVVLGENREAR
jgi:hypothetical protein